MCKTSMTCNTTTAAPNGNTNRSTLNNVVDGDGSNHSTPSTTPTTRISQQQHQYCNDERDDTINHVDINETRLSNRRKRRMMMIPFPSIQKIRFIVPVVIFIVIVCSFLSVRLRQSTMNTVGKVSNKTIHEHQQTDPSSSPYMIIIDGGSTGSRLHIFEFVVINDDEESNTTNNTNPVSSNTSSTTIVERRGSFRTISPLSAFVTLRHGGTNDNIDNNYSINTTDLAIQHIIPLLQYIEQMIPKQYIYITPIYYAATAGMRLLTLQQQNHIYDIFVNVVLQYCNDKKNKNNNINNNLTLHDCFDIPRHHIQTLSGELEAYYGVLAANYLHGKIDTQLRVRSTGTTTTTTNNKETTTTTIDDSESTTMNVMSNVNYSTGSITGALDMGGSSTQIVFYTAENIEEEQDVEQEECVVIDSTTTIDSSNNYNDNDDDSLKCDNKNRSSKERLHEHHFFTMSYLSYGADQFRERLWSLFIYEHETKWSQQQQLQQEEEQIPMEIMNPCSNPGHNVSISSSSNNVQYLLVGIGDVLSCKDYMKRIIPHPIHTPIHHIYDRSVSSIPDGNNNNNNIIGGIEHPSIYKKIDEVDQQELQSKDFLAMSLYFFTFDAVRVFTNDPIMNEKWPKPTILELQNATIKFCTMNLVNDILPLYNDDMLPHKYTRKEIIQHRCMEAIYMISLLESFGFASTERHITFAYDVNGSEVEWTLGMALQYYSNNNNSNSTNGNSNNQSDVNTDMEQKLTCAWDSPHDPSTSYVHCSNKETINNNSNTLVQRVRNLFMGFLFFEKNDHE